MIRTEHHVQGGKNILKYTTWMAIHKTYYEN